MLTRANWHTRHAAHCIRNGGIIAYPTETVYGLGCDPYNPDAVLRLLALKQRDWKKGLILVASDVSQIQSLIQVDDLSQLKQTISRESEPTSWVLPASRHLPLWIRGEHDSVAIRISKHPCIVDLCDTLGQAIVSTSANPSTRKPAINALQIKRYFNDQLDAILHSASPCNKKPSQILHYPSRRRLR